MYEVLHAATFSLDFLILRLKLTSVISVLNKTTDVCVIHQEGEASTPGKSGVQNHLLHHEGPSKFSVKLAFLHYIQCQDLGKVHYFLNLVFSISVYLVVAVV